LGRWRLTDEGEAVDVSGTFPDGARFDSPAAFRGGLVKYRDAFLTTLTERLYAYSLGRPTEGKTVYFDFKESSISPAYARTRTTYTRVN
jgi:hypothetical protein